jgi:hypothetical protein
MLDNNPPSSPDEKEEEPIFEHEKIFDEQIDPLLEKIHEICKEHSIPFLYAFQFSNTQCPECKEHNIQGVCSGGHFPNGYGPMPFKIARSILDKKHGHVEVSAHVIPLDQISGELPKPIKDFMEMLKKKIEE